MANRTDPFVNSVSGSDPQNCLEYITRQRIYDCRYWKEVCFGLNVADVLEKSARTLSCLGSLPYTTFFSLTLKLLQLNAEHEVIYSAFIDQKEFKYATALGALYIRLTSRPAEIYKSLEPLYRDYRKLRIYKDNGNKDPFTIWRMDEYIHKLLTSVVVFGITLPRLPSRKVLQESGYLPDGPRVTALQDVLNQYEPKDKVGRDESYDQLKLDPNHVRLYESAWNYLKHKALVEKCTAASDSWEKRQIRLGSSKDKKNADWKLDSRKLPVTTNVPSLDSEAGYGSQFQSRNASRNDNQVVERGTLKRERDSPATKNRKNDRKYGSLFKQPPSDSTVRLSFNTKKIDDNDDDIKKGFAGVQTSSNNPTSRLVEQESDEYWNEQRAKLGLKRLK